MKNSKQYIIVLSPVPACMLNKKCKNFIVIRKLLKFSSNTLSRSPCPSKMCEEYLRNIVFTLWFSFLKVHWFTSIVTSSTHYLYWNTKYFLRILLTIFFDGYYRPIYKIIMGNLFLILQTNSVEWCKKHTTFLRTIYFPSIFHILKILNICMIH
jgi:hypothetical protein